MVGLPPDVLEKLGLSLSEMSMRKLANSGGFAKLVETVHVELTDKGTEVPMLEIPTSSKGGKVELRVRSSDIEKREMRIPRKDIIGKKLGVVDLHNREDGREGEEIR